MKDFFIPIVNFKVDLEKLKKEINYFIRPDYKQTAVTYGITTNKEWQNNSAFDFRVHMGTNKSDGYGVSRTLTGETDEEITFWPKKLEKSYIKELSDRLSAIVEIENPRARVSLMNGPYALKSHTDPHTPYRIHICIDTNPNVLWLFKNNNKTEYINQKNDGTPVLIETANVEHSVIVPKNSFRMHLWYQYHSPVSDKILNKLKEEYKNASTKI